MEKQFSDKIKFHLNTKQIITVLILVGIIFYVISHFILSRQLTKIDNIYIKFIVEVLSLLLNLIGGVFVGSGILSLLLEISTIRNLIKDIVVEKYNLIISRLLSADFDFSSYNNNILNQIQKKIVIEKHKKLPSYDIDLNKYFDSSVYRLEENISNLFGDLFYEFHDENVKITPIESRKVFVKTITSKYKIVNLFKLKNHFGRNLKLLSDVKNSFKIIYVKVNNEDLTPEILNLIKYELINTNIEGGIYSYMVSFNRDLKDCKEHIISLKFTYEVPMNDICQSFKLSTPSKKLHHTIHLDGGDSENWVVNINAYTAFNNLNSLISKHYNVNQESEHLAEVKFDYWALPGAGYAAAFRKKTC